MSTGSTAGDSKKEAAPIMPQRYAAPGSAAHLASLETLPADQLRTTDRSKLGPTDESAAVKASTVKADVSLNQKMTSVTKKAPTAEELAEQERRKKDPKTIAELARLDSDLRRLDAQINGAGWKPYEPDKAAVEGLQKAGNLFDFLNEIK